MLPALSPAVLKGKSQNAFNKIGAVFHETGVPKVLTANTKKNYVFVGKYITDSENMHFQVYNRKCKLTDSFVLEENGDGLNIVKYSAMRNKVMRPRDVAVSPDKDMTFEQILKTRPVIVKRIESILQAVAENICKG